MCVKMSDPDEEPKPRNLKETCFRAVREHFDAVGVDGVLGLPTPLITDLLPHLTICQLDEIQPVLNQRGISTYSGWIGVLQDMCGPKRVLDLHTEDKAKHEVMKMLFTVVFYGFTNFYVKKNITNLNTPSFLKAAAKCVTSFLIISRLHKCLQRLTAEQRPLLNLFEERMTSVTISNSLVLLEKKSRTALYVFHRLVDHGVANKLVIQNDCPIVLAWLLHGRGSQYAHPELMNLMLTREGSCMSQDASARTDVAICSTGLAGGASGALDDEAKPCKRAKISFVSSEEEQSEMTNFDLDPQVLCRAFAPCDAPQAGEACPRGQIDCLKFGVCGPESFRVLNSALPTFFSLRSLILHGYSTFKDLDVIALARALKQLSESPRCSLTDLSISVLPYTKLMKVLLNANSKMKSLHVEIHTVVLHSLVTESELSDLSEIKADLPLEKLTVKVIEFLTDLQLITSVLRRAPHLTTLHLSGMRLPTGSSQSQLLTTLSESNHCLKSLHLEDMKLSDCLPEILHLLKDCKLEELGFKDCRLLEKWSDKEGSLRQLVSTLKKVPTLHTLSLAQNRLAKNVCVLAELFSGSSPSSVRRLDISSNFIQPADLLKLAETLRSHRPQHRLTLDLRKNPGDRDPDTWDTALKTLRPFCIVLVEGWVSTNTMADHISNM
ncbi:leucine-rich repeat-containing protein 41 [Notolabrus celidotus]|uniref:leucine-rich repeat-containing protein 41 n=1 Tax=Notolabrus celidotus TaxID=1203425 RepID=UPI00148FA583|nr:leucine-rich repeat-containing protein 41 [Notolabrus celidotus]